MWAVLENSVEEVRKGEVMEGLEWQDESRTEMLNERRRNTDLLEASGELETGMYRLSAE